VAQKFVCFNDANDLTEQVQAQIHGPGGMVVLADGQPAPWRVTAICQKDKCENVFSSDIASQQDGDATIVGVTPTTSDTYLEQAAASIGPASSLDRAGESAKFTIQNISLVALVLGGFGIFTDLGGGFHAHRIIFALVTIAAAAALALAIYALFPQVDRNLKIGNLLAVRDAYEKAIGHRVKYAKLAAGALLVALFLALIAFFRASGGNGPDATLSASWDGSGAQGLLSFTASMADLPKGSIARVSLTGLKNAQATKGKQLSKTTAARATSGTATVDEKLVPPKGFKAYRVDAAITWGRKHSRTESLTITPPPFTPPPAATAASPPSSSPRHHHRCRNRGGKWARR
jgi:hypothetical protein